MGDRGQTLSRALTVRWSTSTLRANRPFVVRTMKTTTTMKERTEQSNGVLIKPKRAVRPDDTLTPAEAKIVRRGEAQLKRVESKSWREVKNALPR